MIASVRERYNKSFNEERYRNFLEDLNQSSGINIAFRVAESPVFVPKSLKNKLLHAADEIFDSVLSGEVMTASKSAIPEKLVVPHETKRPQFVALDFAIVKDELEELQPRLIELQGFPSLFCWQHFLPQKFREHFDVPRNFQNHFVDEKKYIRILKKTILGDEDPEQVILLEIDPLKQTTAVDFVLCEKMFGVKPVHIGDVRREGNRLYYDRNGRAVPIRRIYNRVIFDELLQRRDLKLSFNLTEDVDVQWAGHPNWFFRISKYIMPFLKSEFVPACSYLSDLHILPSDLHNYVLKPLFSFSGSGVIFNLSRSDLDAIPSKERRNFILQRKVNYEPVLQAPDGSVKTEIRLMFIWEEGKARPTLVTNLARLSRGEMIGVKYNKDKTWIGGSVCFFEP